MNIWMFFSSYGLNVSLMDGLQKGKYYLAMVSRFFFLPSYVTSSTSQTSLKYALNYLESIWWSAPTKALILVSTKSSYSLVKYLWLSFN